MTRSLLLALILGAFYIQGLVVVAVVLWLTYRSTARQFGQAAAQDMLRQRRPRVIVLLVVLALALGSPAVVAIVNPRALAAYFRQDTAGLAMLTVSLGFWLIVGAWLLAGRAAATQRDDVVFESPRMKVYPGPGWMPPAFVLVGALELILGLADAPLGRGLTPNVGTGVFFLLMGLAYLWAASTRPLITKRGVIAAGRLLPWRSVRSYTWKGDGDFSLLTLKRRVWWSAPWAFPLRVPSDERPQLDAILTRELPDAAA
ncbi:MAG: hypothetical protein JO247_07190 [Chloroflexi bacterium]|nr:hypothetical protein [Chloroflexota bacterium]